MIEKELVVHCDCHDVSHCVHFISQKHPDDPQWGDDLYIYTGLQTNLSFWGRLRVAWRYLMRKDYLQWPYTEALINSRSNDKIEKLRDFLDEHLRPVDPSS